jgi:hypothetical protein
MRQILAISVLLLCGSWAVAQTSGTSGQRGYGQTSSNAASQKTVEGCLSSSAGKYMLTDKRGTTYELTGDSSKLAEHVGHEIKVTGTESAGSASASGGTMGQTAGSERTIEVSSFKHISKTCKNAGSSGGGMSH